MKLNVQNLSAKVGMRIDMVRVEELPLSKKQIDDIELSLATFKCLKKLDLSGNRIRFPRQLAPALDAPILENLNLLGNPISKELADFRLYIIAHSSICLRVLNDEPVTDAERCQAFLQFPERDPFKNAAFRATLPIPLSAALEEAYAATSASAANSVIEAQQAVVAARAAAEREAERRRLEVLENKAQLEREVAEEQRRAQEERAKREQLLAETRRAERGEQALPIPAATTVATAVAETTTTTTTTTTTPAAAPTATLANSPSAATSAQTPLGGLVAVETHQAKPSTNNTVVTVDDTPTLPSGNAKLIAELTAAPTTTTPLNDVKSSLFPNAVSTTEDSDDRWGATSGPSPSSSSMTAAASTTWWNPSTGGGVLDDDVGSVAERARARLAEKKRIEEETLAKAKAVAAARRAAAASALLSPASSDVSSSSNNESSNTNNTTTTITHQHHSTSTSTATIDNSSINNNISKNDAVDWISSTINGNISSTSASSASVPTTTTTMTTTSTSAAGVRKNPPNSRVIESEDSPAFTFESITPKSINATPANTNNINSATPTALSSSSSSSSWMPLLSASSLANDEPASRIPTTSITTSTSTKSVNINVAPTPIVALPSIATPATPAVHDIVPSITAPTAAAASTSDMKATTTTTVVTTTTSTPISTTAITTPTAATVAAAATTTTVVASEEAFSLETTVEALQATVARYERQLAALRLGGAHLVATEKAEANVAAAKARLVAFSAGLPPPAVVVAKPNNRGPVSLSTQLSAGVAPKTQSKAAVAAAASIFLDEDDAEPTPTKKPVVKSKSAKAVDDLFDLLK